MVAQTESPLSITSSSGASGYLPELPVTLYLDVSPRSVGCGAYLFEAPSLEANWERADQLKTSAQQRSIALPSNAALVQEQLDRIVQK